MALDEVRRVTVIRTLNSPMPTSVTSAGGVVTVSGPVVARNVIVSETEPNNPYEGMVWVQI